MPTGKGHKIRRVTYPESYITKCTTYTKKNQRLLKTKLRVNHENKLQRILNYKKNEQTYQVVFASHSELVIQQASNMPDASSVASEAARIVGDVEVRLLFTFLRTVFTHAFYSPSYVPYIRTPSIHLCTYRMYVRLLFTFLRTICMYAFYSPSCVL